VAGDQYDPVQIDQVNSPPNAEPVVHDKTVTGHLHSRTGQYHPDGLQLSMQVFDMSTSGVPVEFERVGAEWIGVFKFEVSGTAPFYPSFYKCYPWLVTPEDFPLSSYGDHCEFMVEDATPMFAISFRPLDAESCEPIVGADVVMERFVSVEPYEPWGSVEVRRKEVYRDRVSLDYPIVYERSKYRWMAFAPGHRVVIGDQDSLNRPLPGEQKSIQQVLLPRGWGTEFLVRTERDVYPPASPLPQATIAIDGGEPLPVDSTGRRVINLLAPPSRIDVYCDGFSWGRHYQQSQMAHIAGMTGLTEIPMEPAR
jgi:hypothetical protein